MGVESEHLVYDYLSRVGDLAQTALPADRRMRLVTELRSDIDRERSKSGTGDDEATVRRILGKLGSPAEVVKAAAGRPLPRHAGEVGGGSAGEAGAGIPVPRDERDEQGGSEAPGSGVEPEWWRVPGPRGTGGAAARTNEVLSGWTGGLLPPELDDDEEAADDDPGEGVEAAEEPDAPDGPDASGVLRRALRRRRRAGSDGGSADGDVVARRRRLPVGLLELVAALALVAGVVLGSWLALGVGWLIAYFTPGLSRVEGKWAALGVPGLVAAGALVWLWGRTNGRWGAPVPDGRLGPVIVADFPVVVKVAALGSALFLLWRSARRFR